jgi:iron complex transport system permease protein
LPHQKTKYNFIFLAHFCACAFVFVNISLGSITIPFIYTSLTGGQASKSSWEYIIMNYRLPKSITAVLVGMGLSISGLLMQTLFRNPLAGPVLGLSSGASLGVAFVLLGWLLPPFLSTLLLSPYGVVLLPWEVQSF